MSAPLSSSRGGQKRWVVQFAPRSVNIIKRAATGRVEVVNAIGVPGPHPHELRHTAASLAIAAGADVKLVQQMLGHTSATMLNGRLFPDRLDEVADALDSAARNVPGVYPLCNRAEIVDLDVLRRGATAQ